MLSSDVFVPTSGNLSLAWAEVFAVLMERGTAEVGPAVVTVSDFDENGNPNEVLGIRERVDKELELLTGRSVDDVATTIFPISLWNPNLKDDGKALFARFAKIWPRLQERSRLNAKGSYFQRLTAYNGPNGKTINQLENVIETYKDGLRRRSAFQASIYDPGQDHTDQPYQGFPCLQQLSFAPSGKDLTVTGYYMLQYAVDRAYGNYLGLCRLGRFMAQQMNLRLRRVVCISSVLMLGKKKQDLQDLAKDVRALTKEQESAHSG
ncbi:MAG TPA: thymidylate synthase [Candidatus Binatia bacterium]|jgi:thymidylate synthase